MLETQLKRASEGSQVVPPRVGMVRLQPTVRNAYDRSCHLDLCEREEGMLWQRLPWAEHTALAAQLDQPACVEEADGLRAKNLVQLVTPLPPPARERLPAHSDGGHLVLRLGTAALHPESPFLVGGRPPPRPLWAPSSHYSLLYLSYRWGWERESCWRCGSAV
eukprot:scaffold171539_cov31-Tisochrysis_lutea.AAC.1